MRRLLIKAGVAPCRVLNVKKHLCILKIMCLSLHRKQVLQRLRNGIMASLTYMLMRGTVLSWQSERLYRIELQ